jgi:dsDNA-binding SOS-regulon protein
MEAKLPSKRRRKPRHYDGVQTTTHSVKDLLHTAMTDLRNKHRERPDLILASWKEVLGEKLASMTEAVSFLDGVLLVKVKNSTLHSLLELHEKAKCLKCLRQKFPNVPINNIVFRIG